MRDRRTGEEHRMDGVSPWKWTVNCHGDCVGHVISGGHVNHGEIKKVSNKGKQRKKEEASSQN